MRKKSINQQKPEKYNSIPQQDILESILLAKCKKTDSAQIWRRYGSARTVTHGSRSVNWEPVSVYPLRPQNPHLHLHQCRRLCSIPGSGIFPGEGNGNPLPSSCLDATMDSEGPLRQVITGQGMRGGDRRGGHRASESVGSNPSPWDRSAHPTHSVIYPHRELEPGANEGRRMKGKTTSSPWNKPQPEQGDDITWLKKGRSHAAPVIWWLLNESGTPSRGCCRPGASAEEAEGAGGSENGDLRPLGGRPSAPGLQRAGRPGPALTPALWLSAPDLQETAGLSHHLEAREILESFLVFKSFSLKTGPLKIQKSGP